MPPSSWISAPTPGAVLLIDEKNSYAEELQDYLNGSGIELTHLGSSEPGDLAAYLRKDWMCILLGVKDSHHGHEIITKVRCLTASPIVALSSLHWSGIESELVRDGADDILIKSVTDRPTVVRVIRVAAARQARRSEVDESVRLMRTQMDVLIEIAQLMSSIKKALTPVPLFKGFFSRMTSPDGRKEIESQVRAVFWFVGKLLLEILALLAAIKGVGVLQP